MYISEASGNPQMFVRHTRYTPDRLDLYPRDISHPQTFHLSKDPYKKRLLRTIANRFSQNIFSYAVFFGKTFLTITCLRNQCLYIYIYIYYFLRFVLIIQINLF